MKFANIKIGDSMILRSYSTFYGDRISLGSVVAVTKTRFKVKFQDVEKIQDFRKKDGREYPLVLGGVYGVSSHKQPVELATEADILEAENHKTARRLRNSVKSSLKNIEKSLESFTSSSQDIEVLRKVESFLLNASSAVKRNPKEGKDEEK